MPGNLFKLFGNSVSFTSHKTSQPNKGRQNIISVYFCPYFSAKERSSTVFTARLTASKAIMQDSIPGLWDDKLYLSPSHY